MAKRDAYRELLDRVIFLGCAGVVTIGSWAINTLVQGVLSAQESGQRAIVEIQGAIHKIDLKLEGISISQEWTNKTFAERAALINKLDARIGNLEAKK